MDPNQNTPPNYRNRKPDNTFNLDTTPQQYSNMASPQDGFMNLLRNGSPIQHTKLFQQPYPQQFQSSFVSQQPFQPQSSQPPPLQPRFSPQIHWILKRKHNFTTTLTQKKKTSVGISFPITYRRR